MEKTPKASLGEIKSRFDADVERFSNLDTGQQTVPDAALMLDLCTAAAAALTPQASAVLDIGCGAGNFSLKLLERLPGLDCRLADLSLPMLKRAESRVSAGSSGKVSVYQTEMLSLQLPPESIDIVLAGAVLHHLRSDGDWKTMFGHFFNWLRPGGSIWISDLVDADTPELQILFRRRYAAFLESLGGAEYRQKVLDYVDYEDSPRSVTFQMECMHEAGFRHIELLHKNGNFAAFGAVKPSKAGA